MIGDASVKERKKSSSRLSSVAARCAYLTLGESVGDGGRGSPRFLGRAFW